MKLMRVLLRSVSLEGMQLDFAMWQQLNILPHKGMFGEIRHRRTQLPASFHVFQK